MSPGDQVNTSKFPKFEKSLTECFSNLFPYSTWKKLDVGKFALLDSHAFVSLKSFSLGTRDGTAATIGL